MSSKTNPRERRLKAIYDSLDSGNNKKAFQEADKVLRKDSSCPGAKALKALALFRYGRAEEAAFLIEEVREANSDEESVLQALTYYYRESHQLEQIVHIYENAVKKNPNNEELITTLFMAYVRVLDHKNQQLTANKLHRLVPHKNPYYFWAVMSILMQAIESSTDLSKRMFLPLAAKMSEAYSSKIQAEAEVQLYLMVLEVQENYEKCLEVMDGPLSNFFSEFSKDMVQRQRLDYYERLDKIPELISGYKNMISGAPNDWNFWTKYIHFHFVLRSRNAAEVSLTDLLHFIEEVIENNPILKGPVLARLELLRRSQEVGELVKTDSELENYLYDYFVTFGTKPSTAADLLLFKSLFSGPQAIKGFIKRLGPIIPVPGSQVNGGASTEVVENGNGESVSEKAESVRKILVRDLHMRINFEQLRRGLGCHDDLTGDAREAEISHLMTMYRGGLLNGLRGTEYQPADDILVILVSLLHDSWVESGRKDDAILLRALYILDEALDNSPSNHYIMIWMLRLFVALGAWSPATNIFDRLDVKQIMYDSMGFLLSRQAVRLGQLSLGLGILNNISTFYKVNWRDMTEHICTAYKIGNFRKIPEFVALCARITSSMESNHCNLEIRVISLLLSGPKLIEGAYEMGTDPSDDVLNFNTLIDGRDLTVVEDFGLPSDQNPKLNKKTEAEIDWLVFRSLILRSLTLLANVVTEFCSSNKVEKNRANGELLKKLWLELKAKHCDGSSDASMFIVEPHPSKPYPVNVRQYLLMGYADVVIAMINFLTDLAEKPQPECLLKLVKSQLQLLGDVSSEPFGCLIQRVCAFSELVCLLTLTYELTFCAHKTQLSGQKKARKPVQDYLNSVKEVIGELANDAFQKIDTLADEYKKGHIEPLAEIEGSLSHARRRVDGLVHHSRFDSLSEIASLLKVKASFSHR